MMRPAVGRTMRGMAIAIAILAAIDPVFTIARGGRPLVAVVAADVPRDSAATARVIASLRSEATVVAGAFGGADATVIVGESLPLSAMESAAPVFAVVPEAARLVIATATAPRATTLDAVIPVNVSVANVSGVSVEVALLSGGIEVDRTTVAASADTHRATLALHAAASDTGVQTLRVVAAPGTPNAVAADIAVNVGARRWNVLFYDARPSWSSRFVRMAVERDPRFAVAGRTVTSRAYVSDAGIPPSSVEDDARLRGFDAVVVGGLGALSDKAVQGLERYMRLRGGSVVLLMDDPPDAGASSVGSPIVRLTGAAGWSVREAAEPTQITAVEWHGRKLRATQVASPDRSPAGMTVIAQSRVEKPVEPKSVAGKSAPARDTMPRAALWATSIGAGRLVVSGALDAWRYRDSTWSNFDRVWQDVVADAAARAPEPVTVSVPPALHPNDPATVRVSLRDVGLRAGDVSSGLVATRGSVSAAIVSAAGSRTPLRLWPAGSIGDFEAALHAPAESGAYHIEATSGADRASAAFVVSRSAVLPAGAGRAALTAWTEGTGGTVITATQLGGLADAIRGAIRFAPRAEPWHPMRSPWWILPFALLLSAEWYLRRRRGLA